MNEDYVSFEQAVKLKEIGFDYVTSAFYFGKELIDTIPIWEIKNSTDLEIYFAPTIYDTRKWLFENYNVWIEQSLVPELDWTPHRFIYTITDKKSGHICHGDGSLKSGISKVLRMIDSGELKKRY